MFNPSETELLLNNILYTNPVCTSQGTSCLRFEGQQVTAVYTPWAEFSA
jgi:hypothetical protein